MVWGFQGEEGWWWWQDSSRIQTRSESRAAHQPLNWRHFGLTSHLPLWSRFRPCAAWLCFLTKLRRICKIRFAEDMVFSSNRGGRFLVNISPASWNIHSYPEDPVHFVSIALHRTYQYKRPKAHSLTNFWLQETFTQWPLVSWVHQDWWRMNEWTRLYLPSVGLSILVPQFWMETLSVCFKHGS
jgi:hypothetical protein